MKKALFIILAIATFIMTSCSDKRAENENAVLRNQVDSLQNIVKQLQTLTQ